MGLFDKILRTGEGKMLRSLQSLVPDVNALEPELQRLDDDELKQCTVGFRERLDRGETLDDLLVEAFAVVREASSRVIGQRHYDVQLMGGAALHFGWVAEMKTGEGKTLVSTLPVYLNGLSGDGLHVVTVNEYLARRDAEWMGQIHNWLGLDVGLIVPGMDDPAHKRRQYAADVTYGTNNEFGFDYLRDNMAMSRQDQVQRGHVYGIVDEIDSILVDEARTPLIISGRVSDAEVLYKQFALVVRKLRPDVDYEVDEEKRQVAVTDSGIEKVEAELGVENLYDVVQTNLVHQLYVALKAKELFHRDKDYIVERGEVKIVDEFTGRTLEGRRWSEGIHQAVEAKENVPVKEENQTLATVTLQNYFRMYEKLAGMTGTAQTEASELASTYGLQVVPIPTNRPMIRGDNNDLIYKAQEAKFDAVVADIESRYEVGQPVLAGTASVEHSERLSQLLEKRGVRHQVLNAKQHARESEIIAQAGRLEAVTVATNMAGRGVDILLGGNPDLLALHKVRDEGFAANPEWSDAHLGPLRAELARLEVDVDEASVADSFAHFEAATVDELRRRVIDLERLRDELVARRERVMRPLEAGLLVARAQLDCFEDLVRLQMLAAGSKDVEDIAKRRPCEELVLAEVASHGFVAPRRWVDEVTSTGRPAPQPIDPATLQEARLIADRWDDLSELEDGLDALGPEAGGAQMLAGGFDVIPSASPGASSDLSDSGSKGLPGDVLRQRVKDLEQSRHHEFTSAEEARRPLEASLLVAGAQRDCFEGLVEQFEPQCREEGQRVIDAGGLYVVGTERHESRRIDNQLRGRSGRQGDPGESRFYISLEDELMRLFASGMIERVMSAAFPDDVPIESRMVTKAVERAQTTVEQRNAEIRKNVLKYDEVMNEQRKVVYAKRNQILDAADLRQDALEALAEAIDASIETSCSSSVPDEWDLSGLVTEIGTYYPTKLGAEDLADDTSADELYERIMGEATGYYERREEELSAELMRELERTIMLNILDQHWREHLYEMDYLQEGINLRAMGQRDPLTEWQREGFDMFSQMMKSVAQDFVRYVMHADVHLEAPAEPEPAKVVGMTLTSSDNVEAPPLGAAAEPGTPSGLPAPPAAPTAASAAAASVRPGRSSPSRARQVTEQLSAPVPASRTVVKDERQKLGPNAPCYCGSGKKYKRCHGNRATKPTGGPAGDGEVEEGTTASS